MAATAEHYRADETVRRVEWKTRGHDVAPGLHDLLVEHGFEPDELETVMVGRTEDLVADVALPEGVTLRQVHEPDDVRRMCTMADVAFGDRSPGMADSLLSRLASGRDDMELWVAETDGEIVSLRAPRARGGLGLRRTVGRRDAGGVARTRDLPRADRRARPVGAAPRPDAGQQRLHALLAADPRAGRAGRHHDDDAVRVDPDRSTRSSTVTTSPSPIRLGPAYGVLDRHDVAALAGPQGRGELGRADAARTGIIPQP